MSIRRVFVAVLLAIGVLTIIWYSGGRRWTQHYVESMSQDWVSFQIPSNSPPLEMVSFSHDANTITVCNKGIDPVSDLLIRINDVYIAKVKLLAAHDCKTMPITDFRTFTWKKIRASVGMPLRRIEVLGTISRLAYLRIDLES